ncbi:MAG: hypothetical protein CMP10_10225, partial [Zetaproteobacteria bacterium]|nr:hypothetical protein [Pseudobdellovibrionaceae bacterium]
LNFDQKLIGKKVTVLIDTYMASTQIYLDGVELFSRSGKHSIDKYYSIQPIPVTFQITKPKHILSFRIDTPLMTGIYQLPFQIRPYQKSDPVLSLYHVWGGELRLISAYVIFVSGLFFLLIYWKTKYPLYLAVAAAGIVIYPFYAFPGDLMIRFFEPENLLFLHYLGIGAMSYFHSIYNQIFIKEFYRKFNILNAIILVVLAATFIFQAFSFQFGMFQIIRKFLFIHALVIACHYIYLLFRENFKQKGNVRILFIGETIFFLTAVHDTILALGFIHSISLIYMGTVIATAAALMVSSNIFATTFVDNKNLLQEVEHINENLEKLVEDRTAQLNQKTHDIHTMLKNLPQGVLTIMANNKIHPEYSVYLEEILQTKKISGEDVIELILSESDLSSDKISQVRSMINFSIGDAAVNFELNEETLPLEIFKKIDNSEKILDLTWAPITDDNDVIEKILLCVKDVTTYKLLEAEADRQKQELKFIGELIAISHTKYEAFSESTKKFLKSNKRLIDKGTRHLAQSIDLLFRNTHTIKGNARTLHLSEVTEQAHITEQKFLDLKNDSDASWEPEDLREALKQLDIIFYKYDAIYWEQLNRNNSSNEIESDHPTILSIVKSIHEVDRNNIQDMQNMVKNIESMLDPEQPINISNIFNDVASSAKSLASEIGIPEPKLIIRDNNTRVHQNIVQAIGDSFGHIFRNSICHGLSETEEGKIEIDVYSKNNNITICIKDSGRGLNLVKIKEKAESMGVIKTEDNLQPEDISNLIFLSHLSTADKLGHLSGRGVGMEAVKAFIEEAGGHIKINFLKSPNNNQDFAPFEFVITLPNQLVAA